MSLCMCMYACLLYICGVPSAGVSLGDKGSIMTRSKVLPCVKDALRNSCTPIRTDPTVLSTHTRVGTVASGSNCRMSMEGRGYEDSLSGDQCGLIG